MCRRGGRIGGARRVGEYHDIPGHRDQRIGTEDVDIGNVVAGHGKSHRVEVAADDGVHPRGQRGQLRTHRAGHVMDTPAGQPLRAVDRDRFGGRLLQGVVGEQPVRRIGELGRRLAAQQCGLHQHRGPIPETCTHRGDVGNPVGITEGQAGHLGQRGVAVRTGQVGDVLDGPG